MDPLELRRFRESVLDAIEWHAAQPIDTNLRTPLLSPEWPRLCDLAPVSDRILLVDTLARRRRDALGAKRPPSLAGRLVWFNPDGSLSDGAAEQASDGYFDVDNVPPWDTWVQYRPGPDDGVAGGFLLAWVPDSLVPLAALGIEANPESCIGWARELRTPFAKALRREGLLL